MYIITILTITGNEVKILDAWNDELLARSEFLKTISDIAAEDGKGYRVLDNIRLE
jgi:hypothetical protein